ncbi:MAG: hypothetical protein LUC43_08915 [Burkholderiales bacterium]|nr:hypothetical protein [Burkholderiales bacterium]
MPACIFLFPNALLSPKESEILGDLAYPKSLQEMLLPCGVQTSSELFNNKALYGSAWQQWLWMLLTERSDLLPTAPYLWKGLGGEKIGAQLWLLSPYITQEGKLQSCSISEDIEEICLVQDLLNPILRRYGFKLQALNNLIFISRSDPWEVLIPIWEAQEGKEPALPAGKNAFDWKKLSTELQSALRTSELNGYRNKLGRPSIEGFWINGGGDDGQLPFTKIRSVQTQSPLIRGLACSCGIPASRVTTERSFWRDVPDGDRIAMFSEFLDPSIKLDATKWQSAWDKAKVRVDALIESASRSEKYHPVFVATNESTVSTAMPKTTKSILPLKVKSNRNCVSWLTANN